jgi:hypothetical protein
MYAGNCFGPPAFGAVAARDGFPDAWLAGAAVMVLATVLMGWAGRLMPDPAAAPMQSRPGAEQSGPELIRRS